MPLNLPGILLLAWADLVNSNITKNTIVRCSEDLSHEQSGSTLSCGQRRVSVDGIDAVVVVVINDAGDDVDDCDGDAVDAEVIVEFRVFVDFPYDDVAANSATNGVVAVVVTNADELVAIESAIWACATAVASFRCRSVFATVVAAGNDADGGGGSGDGDGGL